MGITGNRGELGKNALPNEMKDQIKKTSEVGRQDLQNI